MSNFNNNKLENNGNSQLLPYSKTNDLENKYLKYKQKYLNLKNEKLTINKSLSVSSNEFFYENLINTFKSNILNSLNNLNQMKGGDPPGKKLYYIEGNIGSGKTTLTEKLGLYEDVEIILEAVDIWKTPVRDRSTDRDINVLGAFYEDSKRNAFLFQVVAMFTTAIRHTQPQRSKIRFCERSIDSAYNVFVNNLIRDNLLTDLESYWITEFYRWLKTIIPKPDGIIYVRCDPNVSFKRVNKRNRVEEAGVPLKLLQSIHDRHEEWIKRTSIDVLTINNDKDDDFDNVIRKVFTYLKMEVPSMKRLWKDVVRVSPVVSPVVQSLRDSSGRSSPVEQRSRDSSGRSSPVEQRSRSSSVRLNHGASSGTQSFGNY